MINLGASLNSMNVAGAASSKRDSLSERGSQSHDKSAAIDTNSSALKAKASRPEKKSSTSGRNFADEMNERSNVPSPTEAAQASAEASSREVSAGEDSSYDPSEKDALTPTEAAMNSRRIKPATRQAAMEVFLNRMEAELGVSPGDMMEAFSELSISELSAAPEDSAHIVISKLDLSPSDSVKAFELYNEMLAMAAAGGMSQYLAQNGQQAEVQVLNSEQARLRDLRQSIGQMSDKFFRSGEFAPQKAGIDQHDRIAQVANSQAQSAAGQNQARDAAMTASMTASAADKSALAAKEMASSQSASSGMGGFDISGMEAASETSVPNLTPFQAATEKAASAPAAVAPKPSFFTNQDNAFAALNADAAAAPTSGFDMVSASSAADAPVSALQGLSGSALAGGEMGAFGEEAEAGEEFSEMDGEVAPGTKLDTNAIQNKPTFAMGVPKATTADVQLNVKEIISQAQYLAGKGGGEMKIALNPHGLGEVNLKVKMINGQVNVEMVTASDEAKKVIEKGLGELKENLAAHKLNLESIKIDHAKEISKHMDQQQRDFDQGAQQKFLNDFRERNQGFKREMYELGSANQPASQTRDRIMSSSYDPKKNSKRADGSRRLDLVA